ncbi:MULTISPECIES: hypothetical protein [unclassified Nostoc]|nr:MULTISPECIES: hypothetical protein [unclassified Nostoc]
MGVFSSVGVEAIAIASVPFLIPTSTVIAVTRFSPNRVKVAIAKP